MSLLQQHAHCAFKERERGGGESEKKREIEKRRKVTGAQSEQINFSENR